MNDMLSDRISDLPWDVIDIILSRIPLRDAVRTSILSTKWRHHWTRIESLVLDECFFNNNFGHLSDTKMLTSMYVRTVGDILFSHGGRIRKFTLHIPKYLDMPNLSNINWWIFIISRCGVQDLTLDLGYKFGLRVPSCLFQCMTLKHLSLKCPSSPSHFRELSSLRSLDLNFGVTGGPLLTKIIQNCPLLERFSLCSKTNLGPFVINASKLEHLCVKYCHGFNLILENTPKLSTISLTLAGIPSDRAHIKCQSMLEFFGAAPKIENLTVSGDVLAEWTKHDVLGRLPAPLENHLSLTICALNLCSEAQVRSLFSLINSSPKLQSLDVEVHQQIHKRYEEWDYLQSQLKKAKNRWSLRTLKVSGIKGDKLVIVFIKKFLSSCPMLEKLYLNINFYMISNLWTASKVLTDIKRFRAASSKFEIITRRNS